MQSAEAAVQWEKLSINKARAQARETQNESGVEPWNRASESRVVTRCPAKGVTTGRVEGTENSASGW